MTTIRIERSGGLTGLSVTSSMSTRDLPSSLVGNINKIMQGHDSPSLPLKSTPKGAADYLNYKVTIQDGPKKRVIECNEYDIQDNLKPIIKYIERYTIGRRRRQEMFHLSLECRCS